MISYEILVRKVVKGIANKHTDKLATIKEIRDTFDVSLNTARNLYEEVYPRTEIHENIPLYSNKPVGVAYNNDDGTINIVMADSIEEAMKIQL